MGTNYCLRYVPTEEQWQKLKEDNKTLYYIMQEQTKKNYGIADEIHIGKSSYGWQFAFQIGGRSTGGLDIEKGDDCTRQNAYKVIQEHLDVGYELVDEYGEEVPINEFIALVDSKTATINHYEDGRPDFENDGARWIDTWFC